MANPSGRPAAQYASKPGILAPITPYSTSYPTSLFDNPVLSNVTIKQVYKGKVREYHAHKAILNANSSYFLKAFTGNFKESSESVTEIHDDPDQFEFLLRYLYTYRYNGAAIDKLAEGNKTKRMLFITGLHALVEKYDIPCISDAIVDDMQEQMELHGPIDDNLLRTLLIAYYDIAVAAGGAMGETFTSYVLKGERSFMCMAKYMRMVVSNPIFGADMALALERDSIIIYCRRCDYHFSTIYDRWYGVAYCPHCVTEVEEEDKEYLGG